MAQRVKEMASEEIIDEKKILKEAEEREKEIKKEIKEAKEEEKKQTKELKNQGTKEHKKSRHGKKYREVLKSIDKNIAYEVDEAIVLAKKTSVAKFDASIEVHFHIDKKIENIRGVVNLPGGVAKAKRIALVDDKNIDDLIKKVKESKIDFEVLIAHPTVMPKLAVLAKTLGPKGLMPNPKSGTVTEELAEAKKDFEGGKVEYKADKGNVVHLVVGKVSFDDAKIKENFEAILSALPKGKIKSVYLASSMGPSLRVSI